MGPVLWRELVPENGGKNTLVDQGIVIWEYVWVCICVSKYVYVSKVVMYVTTKYPTQVVTFTTLLRHCLFHRHSFGFTLTKNIKTYIYTT